MLKLSREQETLQLSKYRSDILERYKEFWNKCGTHGLRREDKLSVLKKIAEFESKCNYVNFSYKDKYNGKTLTELFPELVPANLCKVHRHSARLNGLMLYTFKICLEHELSSGGEFHVHNKDS